MFDFSTLDTNTLAETGVPMTVRHPKTGATLLREDGEAVTITLLGRGSATYEDVQRRIQERHVERQAAGMRLTPDDLKAADTDILIACTKGWNFERLDGTDFPASAANIAKFWTDRRFPWLREAAIGFISNHANFLPT